MTNIIQRIVMHCRRVSGARRYGIPYSRASKLQIPKQALIHGRYADLNLPDDAGIKSDILGVLLEDCYGLGAVPEQPRTIIDIGANVGLFSFAARSHFPNALIHAYEPNPRTFPYLEHQSLKHGVAAFNEAVGAASGTVTMAELGDTNLARTVHCDTADGGIIQTSFAHAIQRLGGTVDLAKIDCEGAEWDLFNDVASWKSIRWVRMEYHLWGRRTFDELVKVLSSLGLVITKHVSSTDFGLIWCENKHFTVEPLIESKSNLM